MVKNKTMSNIVSDFFLDLRGVKCPLNFVKIKLQLEKMNTGQVLEILIDEGEAVESVPPSVIQEGHKILEQYEYEQYSLLLIKKQ